MFRRNKYGARKIKVGSLTFDSKLEYHRWLYLKSLQDKGQIKNLQRQVPFELIPTQTEEEIVQLKTKEKVVSKVVERPCKYIADFVYTNTKGEQVIEDTKGMKLPDYIIKRKLMRLQGNPIKEIKRATE